MKLPEGAQEPTIMAISMNMMPVVALSVSSSDEDIVELTSTVEDILLPKIEKKLMVLLQQPLQDSTLSKFRLNTMKKKNGCTWPYRRCCKANDTSK